MATTVGDRVKLRDSSLLGTVKFIGPLQGKKCTYYGIDLDESKGQNDGSIKRHSYFKTQKNKGLFVKKSAILKTNKKKNSNAPRVTVNSKVWIAKAKCYGTVRWIGALQFQLMPNDIFYGIELDSKRGEHNGTLYNCWYFTAAEKHGLFVRAHDLTIIMKPQKITQKLSNLSRLSKLSELLDTVYSETDASEIKKDSEIVDETYSEFEKKIKLCVFKVCFFSDAVQYCKLIPKGTMSVYCLQLGDTPKMGDTVLISSQPTYNEEIIFRNIVHYSLRNIKNFSSFVYYQKLFSEANIILENYDDMFKYYGKLLSTEQTMQNVHRLQLLSSLNSSEKHISMLTMGNICKTVTDLTEKESIFDLGNTEMALSIYDSFVTDAQKIFALTQPFLIDRIRLFPMFHFFTHLQWMKQSNDELECVQLEKSNLEGFICENSVIFHESIIFRTMSEEYILLENRYTLSVIQNQTKNEYRLSSLSGSIQFALQDRLELLLSGYMRTVAEFSPSDIFQVISTFYRIAVV